MSVRNCVPVHIVDIDTFHWKYENFDLLVALQEKSGDNCHYDYIYIYDYHYPVLETISYKPHVLYTLHPVHLMILPVKTLIV